MASILGRFLRWIGIARKPRAQPAEAQDGCNADRSATSPETVAEVVFDEILPNCPRVTEEEARSAISSFERSPNKWNARFLFMGSEQAIRRLVIANLQRISRRPTFRNFTTEQSSAAKAVQISAFFEGFFVPVQIWRSGSECFAMGNEDFNDAGINIAGLEIKVVKARSEEYEKSLAERLEAKSVMLRCGLCDAEWPPASCGDVTLQEERYVLFTCPQCGTRKMTKVEL